MQWCITTENLAGFASFTHIPKYDYMLAAILDAILYNKKMHHFQTLHPLSRRPPSMSLKAGTIRNYLAFSVNLIKNYVLFVRLADRLEGLNIHVFKLI